MILRLAALTLALAPPAGAFDLALPVDCVLGESCYIQQYPDRDPGPGATDFTCGSLSYDGHDGTDFAVPTRAAMDEGVAVLAAAPGRVRGTRDGVADFAPVIPGKECGNGVVIDHGDGWETQYCHLRQGSVLVQEGAVVDTGTPLGLIGQSGAAEFPHVHLSVRRNGEKLDPFAPGAPACGAGEGDLWAADIAYEPGGVLGIGLAAAVPAYEAIKAGLASPPLPADAPALVVWAYLYGTRAGDVLRLSITGPGGEVIAEDVALERTQALSFRAVGRRTPAGGWPAGPYGGTAVLVRDGAEIDRRDLSLSLGP